MKNTDNTQNANSDPLVSEYKLGNTTYIVESANFFGKIKTYNKECTDEILYLIACTDNMEYMELIEKEASRFPDIPIEEYRTELRSRADRS